MTTEELYRSGHRCPEKEITAYHPKGQMKFIEELAMEHCKGAGVDFGCKATPLGYADGVDIEGPYKDNRLEDYEDNSLDYIFTSHVLEHIEEGKVPDILKLFYSKLNKKGIAFIFLPHACVSYWNRNINPEAKQWHLWVPTYEKVKKMLIECGFTIKDGVPHVCEWGCFWIIGEKE